MHPRMMMWRRAPHGAECGPRSCRPGFLGFRHCHYADPGWEGGLGGGPFGVRRPLRFLSWRLGLSEAQVAALATILDELKTERAQAAVDERRAQGALAEILASEVFDEAMAAEATSARTKSSERLQRELVKALGRIHALLDPEQRARFAYLVRSGSLGL